VFEHRDACVEQDRMGRASALVVVVVDVDAVDADEPRAGLDDQLGGPIGQERGTVPVCLGAPVPVPPCVQLHRGAGEVHCSQRLWLYAALLAVGETHEGRGQVRDRCQG
jgi:hypothetical protein